MDEIALLEDADRRGRAYTSGASARRVFPDAPARAQLSAFLEPMPLSGLDPVDTLRLLDEVRSPGTVASNGPRYYGYVVGATLPVAAAADRMVLAWDQVASSFDNSPAAHVIEKVAAGWVLYVLDLPRGSAVGFGTSATACTIGILSAARRALLARQGWDFDAEGLIGAPTIKVVVSDVVHVAVKKALRILGFGMNRLILAPTDAHGRVDPARLPPLDDMTILCLQAGEVNTGEFDPFAEIIPIAKAAGAWVHVDGAFGLWARASAATAHHTAGVDLADSWTTAGRRMVTNG